MKLNYKELKNYFEGIKMSYEKKISSLENENTKLRNEMINVISIFDIS